MIRALVSSLPLIAVLTTAALGGVVHLKNREEAGLRATIAGHLACASGVEEGGDLKPCPPGIAAAALTARRTAACDAALTGGVLFSINAACSAPVKRVVAARDARGREAANLTTTLTQLRADQAAAITRAEQRGRTQAQGTARAQDRLAAAPRTDAGLGRCDADCLQRLGRD